jgi:hypothetical protein
VELVRRRDDDAEPVLGAASCRFVVPVPSRDVRAFLESERERRAAAPQHARERDDAPPHVLRDLWRELATVAAALGIADGTRGDAPYDPTLYRDVYERVLRHRHRDVIALDAVLPTQAMSVHDVASACADLVPDAVAADAAVREAEHRHPDLVVLARDVQRWWADAGDA